MKNGLLSLSLLITLLLSANVHAQLYKWVAPDGKVSYSDTPPPSSAKKVEAKTLAIGGPSTTGLPFELAQAVKSSPVTLYTTEKCEACTDTRNLLNTRGVPYTEKTVNNNDEIARLKQVGGDKKLPFATIGSQKQSGFNSDLWDTALTSAGYPASSQLPKSYRNPAPESAAPKLKAAEAKAANNTPPAPPTDTLPATGNAPQGFRF